MALTDRPRDFEIRLYDPALFSPGTGGALGRCSLSNHGLTRCEAPVVAQYRHRQDRGGNPGGFWSALCARHALQRGIYWDLLLVSEDVSRATLEAAGALKAAGATVERTEVFKELGGRRG